MAFTDGKPFLVTEKEMGYAWSGARDGRNFRCHLCGEFFVAGDYAIFVYANSSESPVRCGNFLACATADGPVHGTTPEMLTAAANAEETVRQFYWWAPPSQQRPPRPGATRDTKADRWE